MQKFKFISLMGLSTLVVGAQAQVTILAGPGNFTGDENVLFNQTGLISSGALITGATNQTGRVVQFWEAGEILVTPSNGQSRVEGSDGTLRNLSLAYADPMVGFRTLIWNLDAAANGMVTFTVDQFGGSPVSQTFNLTSSGQNFFRFQGVGNPLMKVSFLSTVDITNVSQTRIGGYEPVPEPASLAALGLGAAALLRRRKAAKPQR